MDKLRAENRRLVEMLADRDLVIDGLLADLRAIGTGVDDRTEPTAVGTVLPPVGASQEGPGVHSTRPNRTETP